MRADYDQVGAEGFRLVEEPERQQFGQRIVDFQVELLRDPAIRAFLRDEGVELVAFGAL